MCCKGHHPGLDDILPHGTFSVHWIGKTVLCYVLLSYGVLRGSMLGQVLFSICTGLLWDVTREHHVVYRKYSDDLVLYMVSDPSVIGDLAKERHNWAPAIRMW